MSRRVVRVATAREVTGFACYVFLFTLMVVHLGFAFIAAAGDSTALLIGAATAAEITSTPQTETPLVESPATVTEEQAAARWNLTVVEWRRYRDLMKGMRGAVSNPQISPIEVLGIHARSDEERRRYAERWAEMMYEDTDRILAFQREYLAAFRRLYPAVPAIDLALLGRTDTPKSSTFQSGDRLALFAALDDERSRSVASRALNRIQGVLDIGLDFYLVGVSAGSEGDQRIRAWAQTLKLDPELVESRRVTLNYDNGALTAMGPNAKPPLLLRTRDQQTVALPVEALSR